uniref:Uncharacterized protein n=1 Tax=Craspedostauros australis TaxID=1486917 RepID=A0A7R9ZRK4_9STRA|mmetsp:Transcript_7295/g.19735  ORF Transcript_7295/g.19735 Transcript_7295/m.19735 type:complete len:222 (+) Transcript_7295:3-668(+)
MLQYWNVLSTIPDVQNWQQQEDGSQDCIIRLAIFFHDAVYNPKSGTNEIDSARLFLDFVSELKSDAATATTATTKALKITVSPWVASQVVTYILATQKHTLLALPSLMGDTATESDDAMVTTQSPVFGQAVFLDIDMAVLGKEPTTAYPSYAKCIRDEYDHFPFIPDYCKGRSSVLETFLKSSIFCTKYFHDAFDGLARDNLRKEIDQLQEQLRLQSGNDS